MRSKTSKQWLKRHFSDPFVIKAHKEGFRSRASYKLLEIEQKHQLLKKNMLVVELGAAPGGWTQIVAKSVKPGVGNGRVIALDLLPFEEIEGVEFMQGDFTSEETLLQLKQSIANRRVDLLLCDIAPNMSGIKTADLSKMSYLNECVLSYACSILKTGGSFVIKLFHGAGFDQYLKQVQPHFHKVTAKPLKSTKKHSSEVYLVAKEFRDIKNI